MKTPQFDNITALPGGGFSLKYNGIAVQASPGSALELQIREMLEGAEAVRMKPEVSTPTVPFWKRLWNGFTNFLKRLVEPAPLPALNSPAATPTPVAPQPSPASAPGGQSPAPTPVVSTITPSSPQASPPSPAPAPPAASPAQKVSTPTQTVSQPAPQAQASQPAAPVPPAAVTPTPPSKPSFWSRLTSAFRSDAPPLTTAAVPMAPVPTAPATPATAPAAVVRPTTPSQPTAQPPAQPTPAVGAPNATSTSVSNGVPPPAVKPELVLRSATMLQDGQITFVYADNASVTIPQTHPLHSKMARNMTALQASIEEHLAVMQKAVEGVKGPDIAPSITPSVTLDLFMHNGKKSKKLTDLTFMMSHDPDGTKGPLLNSPEELAAINAATEGNHHRIAQIEATPVRDDQGKLSGYKATKFVFNDKSPAMTVKEMMAPGITPAEELVGTLLPPDRLESGRLAFSATTEDGRNFPVQMSEVSAEQVDKMRLAPGVGEVRVAFTNSQGRQKVNHLIVTKDGVEMKVTREDLLHLAAQEEAQKTVTAQTPATPQSDPLTVTAKPAQAPSVEAPASAPSASSPPKRKRKKQEPRQQDTETADQSEAQTLLQGAAAFGQPAETDPLANGEMSAAAPVQTEAQSLIAAHTATAGEPPAVETSLTPAAPAETPAPAVSATTHPTAETLPATPAPVAVEPAAANQTTPNLTRPERPLPLPPMEVLRQSGPDV